jgi:spermidine/putrescine transport system permease protein
VRRWFLGALRRVPVLEATAALLPAALWMLLWFGIPIAIMGSYAFRPRHLLGGVYSGWTTISVARVLDPLYLTILSRSLLIAAVATALTLLLAYPIALVTVRATRWRSLMLLLVVLPFWTSFLIRTYATVFLLRDTGPLNQLLMAFGVTNEPVQLLYTTGAVLFGLVTCSIPFAVLPIYASLEKLDPVLHEAAEVLGATAWRRFVRVTWPLTLPGVIAGAVLVFIPTLGSFLTSDLLGGAKVVLIGNLIQNQFTSGRNWPFGSALAFLLMAVVLVGMLVRLRWARDESLA